MGGFSAKDVGDDAQGFCESKCLNPAVEVKTAGRKIETEKFVYTVMGWVSDQGSFVKDWVSGKSSGDVGVLVVPADESFEESIQEKQDKATHEGKAREHSRLLNSLGCKNLIVLVSRMDSEKANYSEERFIEVRDATREMLKATSWPEDLVEKCPIIPVSSAWGPHNIIKPCEGCTFWKGFQAAVENDCNAQSPAPSAEEGAAAQGGEEDGAAVDDDVDAAAQEAGAASSGDASAEGNEGRGDDASTDAAPSATNKILTLHDALNHYVQPIQHDPDKKLRLPLTGAFKIKNFGTVLSGKVLSGEVTKELDVSFFPCHEDAPIEAMVLTVEKNYVQMEKGVVGENVGMKVTEMEKMPQVGDIMIAKDDTSLKPCKRFTASITAFSIPVPITPGYSPIGHAFLGNIACKLVQFKTEGVSDLKSYESAECVFEPQGDMVIERFDDCEALGRISFFDGNSLVMLGKVTNVEFAGDDSAENGSGSSQSGDGAAEGSPQGDADGEPAAPSDEAAAPVDAADGQEPSPADDAGAPVDAADGQHSQAADDEGTGPPADADDAATPADGSADQPPTPNDASNPAQGDDQPPPEVTDSGSPGDESVPADE